jgi:uncharacterized protein
MKYALLITQSCNLACKYCYISKHKSKLDLSVAKRVVDYIYKNSVKNDNISIGFFGGEPLLEFELMKELTFMIEKHPDFNQRKIEMQVTSNGTIFSRKLADFLIQHNIGLGVSCDGIPAVQNANRKYADGRPSSTIVEETIKKAIEYLPEVMINAVYTPSTYKFLPESIEYFYSLGIRKIFINPDFSGVWQPSHIVNIQEVYNNIAKKYICWHESNDPVFISLIDGKIIVMLNDGYNLIERCQMGKKEFAITPNGNIFPCERLVGDGGCNEHCIGNIDSGVDYRKFCRSKNFTKPSLSPCIRCTLNKYCMNWCGCSNYFSTGNYNQAGPFLCASEKAAINAAFIAFQYLENKFGASLIKRLSEYQCGKKQLLTNHLSNSISIT